MGKFFLILLVFPIVCFSQGISKWIDADGKTHFGDQPPIGANAEKLKINLNKGDLSKPQIDKLFMVGRWKSDESVSYGTKIPSQIYVFTSNSQGVEGRSGSLKIDSYAVSGDVITLSGGLTQQFTVVDRNTVIYKAGGGAGDMKLHRQ